MALPKTGRIYTLKIQTENIATHWNGSWMDPEVAGKYVIH